MASKPLKRLRRHYSGLMRVSFAGVLWVVNVLLIPWALMSVVAYTVFACLVAQGVTCEQTHAMATLGTTITGVGALILAAMANHSSWAWCTNRKPFGVPQAAPLVLYSLGGNAVWIAAMIAIFAYSNTFVSRFDAAERAWPLLTNFLLSWIAGFFAYLLVQALSGMRRKDGGKPFRGRRLLSGKEQAMRLAQKKRRRL
jgi:hypothetical protein